MTAARPIRWFAVALLGGGTLLAQPPGAPGGGEAVSANGTNRVHSTHGRGSRSGREWNRDGRSPMEHFRHLLTLSPAEREKELADRSESSRKMLLSKLQEYDAMAPEQRELRLRSTQLRWDMMYLLRVSPERRAEKVAAMPEAQRELVTARLQQWDALSPELQKEVLEHHSTLYYVARVDAAPAQAKEDVFADLSPERRERVKGDIARWRALPADQRNRIGENFHRFFELSESEQEKILNSLSWQERLRAEQTLADIEKLPPEERRRCIESMKRFGNLSQEDKVRFLMTAERWEKMTPEERNAWRNLVSKMPPLPPPPAPPRPPGEVPPNFPSLRPAPPAPGNP